MKQLLSITSIPIQYEISTERARLEIKQEHIRVHPETTQPSLEITTQPVQMRLDTFEYRKSVGLKSVRGSNEEMAQKGMEAATKATGEYGDFGNQILHIEKGGNIPDTAFAQYFKRATEGNLVFIPISPMEISWTDGGTQIQYNPMSVKYDWTPPKVEFEFVPGNRTMTITQYPSLKIEYLGGPIYVPPSADPNFEASA